MKLTETERERLSDSVLKIQSVRASLDHVAKSKIPEHEEIDACLRRIDRSFRESLGYVRPTAAIPGGRKDKSKK
jgi:hypothetical protein